MTNLTTIAIGAGIIIAVIIILGIIMARLYKRSSKEISFVRTGFGGDEYYGGGCCWYVDIEDIEEFKANWIDIKRRIQ